MNESELMQFKDWIPKIEEEGTEVWVNLFKSIKDDKNNLVIYSCLLKKNYVEESLKDYSWDFHITDIYGNEKIIPLLIKRHFYGIKPDYWEITEDIRLFFRLYQKEKIFYYIDSNGDEEEVIKISDDEVKIKRNFLKEYLFTKKYVLAQFYDFFRYSDNKIKDLGFDKIDEYKKESKYTYHLYVDDDKYSISERKSIASILGKSIISVSESFNSKVFSEEKDFEEFDIANDVDGNKVSFTCDEKILSNYFGANKGNPHYLTPVYFDRKVIDKYYSDTTKYSVKDGYLSCQDLWGLRLDNSCKDYVMVFLGDLGHLTNKEQKHWKAFNIIIDGKMSSTCFKRSFMAEFCDPETADLYFKQKFSVSQTNWYKNYGWHLFLPLSEEDKHHFDIIRIPTKNTQDEFDSLILSITKILIDSINIKQLKSSLISEESEEDKKQNIPKEFILKNDDKSIEIFRKYFAQKYNIQFPEMIQFLKDLQNLRSAGSAHRKGSNYDLTKKKFGIVNNFKEVFENILVNCIRIINTISSENYNLLYKN
jgi:hypothetical protein